MKLRPNAPCCVQVSVLCGVYLMVCSFSNNTMWGNLSVYVISYFHIRVEEDIKNHVSWVISSSFIAWSLGMFLCERITRFFGSWLSALAMCTLFNLSLFASYLCAQHSFASLVVTYGFLCGFALGVCHGLCVLYLTMWVTPKHMSMAVCSVMSCQFGGSLIMNCVITWFINPSNLSPDSNVSGEEALFSQPELLDRVPYVFVLHGCIALTLTSTSAFLLRIKPSKENSDNGHSVDGKIGSEKENDTNISSCQDSGRGEKSLDKEEKQCHNLELQTKENNSNKLNQTQIVNSNLEATNTLRADLQSPALIHQGSKVKLSETTHLSQCENGGKSTKATHSKSLSERQDMNTTKDQKSSTDDIAAAEALRTKEFYALFILIFCSDACVVTLGTYFKLFGMSYFPDDHFFAATSVANSIASLILCSVVGIAGDVFGVKNTLIGSTSLLCVFVSFIYPVAKSGSKWLYAAWIAIATGTNMANYTVVPFCALYYFGRTHGTTICGMTMSAAYLSNGTVPFVIRYILAEFGWLTLFSCMGVVCLVALLTIAFALPAVSRLQTRAHNKDDNNSDNEIHRLNS